MSAGYVYPTIQAMDLMGEVDWFNRAYGDDGFGVDVHWHNGSWRAEFTLDGAVFRTMDDDRAEFDEVSDAVARGGRPGFLPAARVKEAA